MGARILVTGGAGFIGRNISESLSTAYDLTVLNSRELNLLDPVRVADCLKSGRFDAVIHTATYDAAPKHSVKDPAKVLENNLRMFFNIVRMKSCFGKLIYFGSGAEFGREHWIPKMTEDYFDRHVPSDQYGFSKYVMTRQAVPGSGITNLRLFGVFGEYDDWRTRFIPNVCCQAVFGHEIRINRNRSFDFLDVSDLARIVGWFLENTPRENTYNVCTGQAHDFVSVARMIMDISGRKLGMNVGDPQANDEYSGDNARLLKEMNGFPFTPIRESLKRVYRWYDSHKTDIDERQI